MSFEIVEKGALQRNVSVDVSGQELGGEEDKSYASLRRQTSVKGFRKGKVPKHVLRGMYGRRVRAEAVERLMMSKMQEVFRQLNEDGEVLHFTQARVTREASKQGFAFELDVEMRPEVELEGYFGLEATREVKPVTEEDVEETLEGLRARFATLEEVEGRDIAEDGDVVSISYQARGEGPLESFKGESQPVELGAGEVLEGLEEALLGAKVGSAVEAVITLPDPYPATPQLAGEAVTLDVEIEGLKRKVLPELDDALAQMTGQEDLEGLRGLIRMELETERDRVAANGAKEQLMDQLLEQCEFELPELYVGERIDRRREHRSMLMGPDADMSDLEETVRRDVRKELILDMIAEREEVEVKPEMLRQFLMEQAQMMGMSVTQLQQGYNSPESREVLMAEIRRAQALEAVYENASIEDVEPSEEDDEEEEESDA